MLNGWYHGRLPTLTQESNWVADFVSGEVRHSALNGPSASAQFSRRQTSRWRRLYLTDMSSAGIDIEVRPDGHRQHGEAHSD